MIIPEENPLKVGGEFWHREFFSEDVVINRFQLTSLTINRRNDVPKND